jgi:hypothetical protein
LPATAEVFESWQRIAFSPQIVGKQTHDAHLVAVMQVYGAASILTFNVSHFQRFADTNVLNPPAACGNSQSGAESRAQHRFAGWSNLQPLPGDAL